MRGNTPAQSSAPLRAAALAAALAVSLALTYAQQAAAAPATPAPASPAAKTVPAAPAAATAPSTPPVARPTPAGVDAAVALRQQGDLPGAARVLFAVLEQTPHDPRAHHELGVLYATTGQWQQAEARLAYALQLAPNAPATQLVLADVLRANLRCLRALPLYQGAARDAVHAPMALRGTVLCGIAAGELQQAQTAAQQLAQWAAANRADADARWAADKQAQLAALAKAEAPTPLQMDTQGRALFDAKQYAEAQIWLQWALDAEPTSDRAYRLAIAAAAADQLAEAAAALERALALDPAHGPTKAAQPAVLRALRLRGHAPLIAFGAVTPAASDGAATGLPAELALARALLDGDLLLARNLSTALSKAAGAKPGVRLLLWITEVQLRDKQTARAALTLRDAVALAPLHDGVRKLQAELAIRQGRTADARALLGLPATPDLGDEDLQTWSGLRRQEFDHQLRMRLDPGLRAGPPLQDQLAEALGRLRAQRAAEVAAKAAAEAEAAATAKLAAKPAGKPANKANAGKRTGRP